MATWNNFALPFSISSSFTSTSLQWRSRCVVVPSFSSVPSLSFDFNRGIRRLPLSRGLSVGCRLVVGEGDGEAGTRKNEMDRVGEKRLVRTLLVDNYDSYTYNIYQDLSVINGVPPVVIHNDDWTWEYIRHQLYVEKAFDNIVISPGPGSPGCPEDVGVCLQILMECEDIPILGVCLGHQALAFVHGAQVIHAPEPIHGRLSEIEHSCCNLFKDIPSGSKSGFKVVRYHSLVIDHNSLPNHLLPIAWTSSVDKPSLLEVQNRDDIYHLAHKKNKSNNPRLLDDINVEAMAQMFSDRTRVLMGIRHSNRPHFGVQFHPESIATYHGRKVFENFREITVEYGLRSSAHYKRKVYLTQEIPKETIESNSFNKTINGIYLHAQKQSTLLHKSMDIKYLKLQWKKLDGLANQVGGTENIFMELFGSQNGNDTFWLDSSSTDMRRARFSFMGGKGGNLWKQITYHLSDASDQRINCGGYMTIQDATGCEKKTYLKNGFLEFLNQELKSFFYDNDDYKSLPFDFHGGFVGFIGYNMKVECGALSNNHKSGTPDACFFFADNLVVVDHSNDDVYILSVHNAIHSIGLQEHWIDETEMKLLNLRTLVATKKLDKKKTHVCSSTSTIPSTFYIEKTRHQYIKDVEKCLQFIHDGESYELCLTTQMKMSVRDLNSLKIYRDLRNRNPAPYAAWLNFSKEKLSICCSSPERFLQLDENGILEAKPIKGTIGRGLTLEEDEHLKLQLQHSEKDQAENLMIVDLLRNDLGRVCEPGTVHVPRLMEVESYSTVHTLVSTIRGTKIPNASPVDCFRASFPGGSMTGAPKLRSMELLDSLECSARGIYSGSIGFFSYNQTFDFNIVIRTIVIHNEEASIGAGGAVIALSNPNEEYDEMILKTKAPTNAVVNVQLNKLNSCDQQIVVIQ